MSFFNDNENLTLPAPPTARMQRSPSDQRMRSSSPKHLSERKRSYTRQNSNRSESTRRGNKKSSPRQNRRRQKQSQPMLTRIQKWFVTTFSCVSCHSVVSQNEKAKEEKPCKSPQASHKSTPPCTPQYSQTLNSKNSNDKICSENNKDDINNNSNNNNNSDCPSVSFSYQQMFIDRDTAISQASNNVSPSLHSISLKSILKKPKSDSDVSSPPESPSTTIEGAANNIFSSGSSVTKAMPMSSAANTSQLSLHVAFKRPPPIRTSSAHNFPSPTSSTFPSLNRTPSQTSAQQQQPILLARTLRRVQSDVPHQFTHHQVPSSPTASVNTSYSNASNLTLPSANTSVTQTYNHLYQSPVKSNPTSPSTSLPSPPQHQQQRTLPRIPSVNSSASFQHRVEQELQRKRSVEEEDFMLAVRLSQEDILHTHCHSHNNSHSNSYNNSHNNSFIVTSPKTLSRTSSSQISSPASSFYQQQQRLTSPPVTNNPSWSNSPRGENKSNVEEEKEEEDESVFRVSSSSSNLKNHTQSHINHNNLNNEEEVDVALELAMRQSLDEDVKHRQRLEIREKLALSRALVASVTSAENLTTLKGPLM